MAEVRLADIVEPSVFTPYMLQRSTELSRLFQSGIISTHEDLSKKVETGGRLIEVPFWNDLASDEPNISSDDPASSSTPKKMTAARDQGIMHNWNQSWSAMDLTADIAGDDPMRRIADRVAKYWERVMQKSLIRTLNGILADNAANDASDMIKAVGTDDAAAVTAAELISAEAILDGAQTMGDAKEDLVALAVHSAVHTRLQKNNLIDTVQDSEGKVLFERYLGYMLIVDDGLPAVAGVNRITYTSYLFGRGAVAFAEGKPKVPTETERKPSAGDGGGQELLYSRRKLILHPRGVKYTDVACAGTSPTFTELATATNWDRVYDRKMVRIAAIKTNG